MEFSRQLKQRELEIYIKICSRIWGGVPVDVDWAVGTKLYKEQFMKEFCTITIKMAGEHIQSRLGISREEFDKDKKLAEQDKKYKSKYDIYNCIVEGSPILQNCGAITIGSTFNCKIPYNGGADCKVEIINVKEYGNS